MNQHYVQGGTAQTTNWEWVHCKTCHKNEEGKICTYVPITAHERITGGKNVPLIRTARIVDEKHVRFTHSV